MKKTQKIEIKLFLPAEEVKRTGGRVAAVNFLYNAWNESAGLLTAAIQNQAPGDGMTGSNVDLFKSLFPITDNATLASHFKISPAMVRKYGNQWNLNKNYKVWPARDLAFVMKHYNSMDPEVLGKCLSIPRTRWAVMKKHGELAKLEREDANKISEMLKTQEDDIQTEGSNL